MKESEAVGRAYPHLLIANLAIGDVSCFDFSSF
jgi:hypothetical protein